MADPDLLRGVLQRALDHALEYRAALPERSVAPEQDCEQLFSGLHGLQALPDRGLQPVDVLDELVRLAGPGLTGMAGPRFFGWVIGGTLPAALAADWMTACWDQNAGTASGAPAALVFEALALSWVRQALALPESATGALVTGATSANFAALAAARSSVLGAVGWDVEQRGLFGAPQIRVLVGHERHETIDKALRLLGMGKHCLQCVDTDGQGRMNPKALQRALHVEAGPVIVCAQLGNVNSGAFDPLAEIHEALGDYRTRHGEQAAWLHVDGAFGLWARACRAKTALAQGAELADSWATDAHKVLNVPYDSGLYLTRHVRAARRAMGISAPYLSSGAPSANGPLDVPNPALMAPELSRRARGFALWAALRQLGREGLDELVTKLCEHARLLAQELASSDTLSVLNEVVFNQVVVYSRAPESIDPHAWNSRFALAIQAEGTCYATPTIWRGRPALRFSVTSAETGVPDIHRAASAVRQVDRQLRQALARA
jgi:glutamate/tyrosine decarboxylase-like PLP-dependent enzyme